MLSTLIMTLSIPYSLFILHNKLIVILLKLLLVISQQTNHIFNFVPILYSYLYWHNKLIVIFYNDYDIAQYTNHLFYFVFMNTYTICHNILEMILIMYLKHFIYIGLLCFTCHWSSSLFELILLYFSMYRLIIISVHITYSTWISL